MTADAPDDIDASTMQEVVSAIAAINLPELVDGCTVVRLSGGASNQNFVLNASGGQRLVLRLTSGGHTASRFGLDRWRGLDAHRSAERAGVAPALLGITLPHGHSIVQFVEQPVVDEYRIREPEMLIACTAALKRVHKAAPIAGSFRAGTEIARYVDISRREDLAVPDDIRVLVSISETIDELFDRVIVPDRLCHNDVQLANFLSDGRTTWLLDLEYAGQGNPYFDLGMIAENASLDDDEMAALCDAYFGVIRSCDVARVRLQRFLVSIREAMWSVVAKPVLGGTKWDYDAWADRYFTKARDLHGLATFTEAVEAAQPQVDDITFYREML